MSDDLDVPVPAGPLDEIGFPGNLSACSVGVGIFDAKSVATQSYIDNQIMQNDDGNVEIKGDLVVNTAAGEQVNVCDFITAMQDRMCIIQPNIEAMEEYPALKDAYDQYKMLEKLLIDNNKPEKK